MRRLLLILGLLVIAPSLAEAQIVTADSLTTTCPTLNFSWPVVASATSYQLVKLGTDDDDTILFEGSLPCILGTCNTGPHGYILPGKTYGYKVRGMVAGVWQAFGPTTSYTFTCETDTFAPIGAQNTLTALFNFPDDTSTPLSPADANTLTYTTFNNFIQATSYNQASIVGSTVGYFLMPHPISYYCITPPVAPSVDWTGCGTFNPASGGAGNLLMESDANTVLTGLGYTPSSYEFIFHIYSHISSSYSNGVFGTSFYKLLVLGHEWGHHEGLFHSSGARCGVSPGFTDTVQTLESPNIGDHCNGTQSTTEPMGSDRDATPVNYSLLHRTLMGWIPSAEAIYSTSCGTETVTLKAADGLVGPRELRIPIYAGGSYPDWVYSFEYRPDGVWVWIHMGAGSAVWGFSEDMYRVNNQLPITLTDSFTDPWRGIEVRLTSSTATEAVLYVYHRCACGA